MLLKELIKNEDYEVVQGSVDIDINNICWDSRKASEGDLFICVKNRNVDRHSFAFEAALKGAAALIIEHEVCNISKEITVIKVLNTRIAMARMAAKYYKYPSREVKLIGITGTKGKTSVSYFLKSILEYSGLKTGIIGTIENVVGDKKVTTEKLNPTTPDSLELQSMLREMKDTGASHVVMEVTSSALASDRVYGCEFDIAVFTNFSQDHLEEHGTMENYKNAKLKLFKMASKGVVNVDDEVGVLIKNNYLPNSITYGIHNDADIMAFDIKLLDSGMAFSLKYFGIIKEVFIRTLGMFNVYNALAAIGAAYLLKIPVDDIIAGINKVNVVPGRFELIKKADKCDIVIDYAHTPASLENVISSARKLSKGRVITVFGCGGDRDKSKRAIMGEIAGIMSDLCIITSDNPRHEDSKKIIEDIEVGIKKTKCRYEKIENRKDAIFKALKVAQNKDMVIIAGKGHENYQIIGDNKFHFDDKEIVSEFYSV